MVLTLFTIFYLTPEALAKRCEEAGMHGASEGGSEA
jgi:hypothetical protein